MSDSFDILTQADFTLNRCGRPEAPAQGLSALYIPHSFLVQVVFPASTGSPTQTITKEIVGDTLWAMRSIQMTSASTTAISLQVLLPNGKFLVSNLQDALQIAGYGSYRYVLAAELRCPPGSKVQVTFQVTNTTLQQPIAMLFCGAYEYLMKGGENRVCPVSETAQSIPRYFGHPNQNVMAPAWQQGASSPTPDGYVDEDYVYSALGPASTTWPAGTPGTTVAVTAANLSATQSIGMDNAEFHVQRILVQISEDNTVTSGSILARLRTGSGYAFTDDYLDAARYIGSAPYPVDWVIPPNDSVYADLQAVDVAGTGNIYWTMFLEGFKRRRRAV
jgi:hypothetical protein